MTTMTTTAEETSAEQISALLAAEARRMLDEQAAAWRDLRGRAISLLGAAGIITTLFGIRTAGQHYHGWRAVAFVAALAAFGAMTICVIYIQRPLKTVTGEKLDQWIEAIRTGEQRRPLDFHFHYAVALNQARKDNDKQLAPRYTAFKIVCALLAVEVVLVGISLA